MSRSCISQQVALFSTEKKLRLVDVQPVSLPLFEYNVIALNALNITLSRQIVFVSNACNILDTKHFTAQAFNPTIHVTILDLLFHSVSRNSEAYESLDTDFRKLLDGSLILYMDNTTQAFVWRSTVWLKLRMVSFPEYA
jgi:hypothetical protein